MNKACFGKPDESPSKLGDRSLACTGFTCQCDKNMLYFEGYCPECLLHGREVPMVLNQDDFWESPESGLQIAISAPFATILRWRGQGKLMTNEILATNHVSGMVLAEARKEEGAEIQPDEENLIMDNQSLEWYLHEICDDLKTFQQHRFDSKDPAFDRQRRHLETISPQQWNAIFDSYQAFCNTGLTINIMRLPAFQKFHHLLQQTGVLFHFKWQAWHRGWVIIRNPRYYYPKASLLELSMYLSAIFLSEPYDEGSVEFYFNDKTIDKILKAIQEKVLPASLDDGW